MKKLTLRNVRKQRKGSIVVLSAFLMVAFVGFVAFAVDLGYLQLAKTEMQQSADAAALAACSELIDDEALSGHPDLSDEIASARAASVRYAALNRVCAGATVVDSNTGNATTGDVVIGNLADPSDRSSLMTYTNPDGYNSVQVTVRKTSAMNGEIPYFFGRVFGLGSAPGQASSTAALLNNISGFRMPADDSNMLGILPFALDKQTWDGLLAGGGSDNWCWDTSNSQVHGGADSIREVNLYPQGTDSPGNRGTVDIGGSNNSTADIARQIVYGISEADLAHFENSQISFDASGKLYLNGDTGISAGVKDELASISGQPRIIPIFSSVSGPGNNAQYTIVAWGGVRIMEVVLTGPMSSKRVIIQPCKMVTTGAIANTGAQSSNFVYSPVWLVR